MINNNKSYKNWKEVGIGDTICILFNYSIYNGTGRFSKMKEVTIGNIVDNRGDRIIYDGGYYDFDNTHYTHIHLLINSDNTKEHIQIIQMPDGSATCFCSCSDYYFDMINYNRNNKINTILNV